jgi:hypothetical protein
MPVLGTVSAVGTILVSSVADPDPTDPYFLGLLDPDHSIAKQK